MTFIVIYFHYMIMFVKTTPSILNNLTTNDTKQQEIIRQKDIYIIYLEEQLKRKYNL